MSQESINAGEYTNSAEFPRQPNSRPSSFSSALTIIAGTVFLLFVALIVLAYVQRPESTVAQSAQSASTVVSLSDGVSVKTSGQSGFQKIEKSISVEEGDEIQTSEAGRGVLVYPNGALTALEGNTHIAIEKLTNDGNKSRISLQEGSIWSRIENVLEGGDSFEVRTEDAVTSVRGTEFEVEKNATGTALRVVRNEVAVAAISSATNTSQSVLRVLSGEVAAIPSQAEETETATTSTEEMSSEEIGRIIQQHAAVDRTLTRPEIRRRIAKAQGRNISEAGTTPGSIVYSLERIGEKVSGIFARSDEAVVERNMALAEERLAEAQAIATQSGKGAREALSRYQNHISKAAEKTTNMGSSTVQERVAEVTRSHQSVLNTVLERVPEEARPAVKQAKDISNTGHQKALSALASTSPERAINESVQTIKENMRTAQEEASRGNNINLGDALRNHDKLMQLSSKIADSGGSDAQRVYADNLGRSLSVVETMEKFDSNLSPGVGRAIDEVRSRTIDSQLSSLSSLATQAPEDAVEIYGKSADMYLEKLRRGAKRGDVSAEDAKTYQKYTQFGEEMASLAQGATTTEGMQKLVETATSHHRQVLEDIQDKLPEEAQQAVGEAIRSQQNIRSPKTNGETIAPSEFVEDKKQRRPRGNLESLPQQPSTTQPQPAPSLQNNRRKSTTNPQGQIQPPEQPSQQDNIQQTPSAEQDSQRQPSTDQSPSQQKTPETENSLPNSTNDSADQQDSQLPDTSDDTPGTSDNSGSNQVSPGNPL